jgi:hypothetical protein
MDALQAITRKIWLIVRPFRGGEVRRMAAWLTLAVAFPRLPFFPGPAITYPLGILPQATFGWLFLAAGLALLATCHNRFRLRLSGRLVALAALLVWSVLAAATTSMTSKLLDTAIMWAMLGEITAGRDDEC